MKPRSIKFTTLSDAVADARRLQKGGYAPLGNWNLSQTLRHLSVTMEMSRRGFPPAVRMPAVLRWMSPVVYVWVMRFGMPRGVPAPPLMVPGPLGSDGEAVERFAAEVDAYEGATEPLAISPLFGRLTREQWTQIHLVHAAHHLRLLLPTPPTPPA